jgi:hypothetical protein
MKYVYEVNRTRGAFDFSVSRDYDTVYEAALALFDALDALHPGDWYLALHGVVGDFPPGEDLSASARQWLDERRGYAALPIPCYFRGGYIGDPSAGRVREAP